ncbi:hypothetical protein LTR09_009291 [Extremus antarcticus]|uniref:Nuclear matrix protein n=1 Tax=Extremus antarcticus TaxID=702011 RepID=A0AAJ0DFR9_9PEZI|nr:hypothetical protein LTR09_009291 [Extremus antarcticus]
MAIIIANELQPVVEVNAKLQALLQQARNLKPNRTVDPPLPTAELTLEIRALHDEFTDQHDQAFRFSTVETAAREIFYALISSSDIQDPADEGKCAPDLGCLLIEELLDSQTTHGCRVVFDYLENRRERLAQKDFHKKNLVFLRSCNELLRRLSRAEDAIFCGRVFFFLFQTFPLGDKSSVNLRGEFHTENTTKFEVADLQADQDGEKMELDNEQSASETATPKVSTPQPPTKPGSKAVSIKPLPKKEEEVLLSADALYGMFWRLQQDFSDPTRLFSAGNFQTFKKGLDRTITKFKKTPTVVQTQASNSGKRGVKRRLDEDGATSESGADSGQLVDNYNPKYLTSRDLFELELSDLAFQRHIMVQSLILIDFLLSLTEKAKKKLTALDPTNKSMLYSFTLSDDDSKWAITTRSNITNYLSASPEGRLFNRMVETVLARDKNWIRWKVESCPSIVKDPASTSSEMEARKGARDATKIRRVPERPTGSMNYSFLDEGSGGGLEALKSISRYTAPTPDELLDGIQTDELDLDFAAGDEATNLQNAIANKRWKLLRQTRASRLALLDKVEPEKNLNTVFRPSSESRAGQESAEAELEAGIDDVTNLLGNGSHIGQQSSLSESSVDHEPDVRVTADGQDGDLASDGNAEQPAAHGVNVGEKLEVE